MGYSAQGGVVYRGWFIGSSFGVDSFSFVLHIGDITFGTGGVSNDLDTSIGKIDAVVAVSGVSVTGLFMREGGFGVVVGDAILVLVDGDGIGVDLLGGVIG